MRPTDDPAVSGHSTSFHLVARTPVSAILPLVLPDGFAELSTRFMTT